MVMVSTKEVSQNFNILFPLMSFLLTTLNAFVFSWGILTPTLLDVVAILGLPVGGRDVHADPGFSDADPNYSFPRAFANLMAWNSKTSGDVTDAEHYAFLMYFFNKYFSSNKSFGLVKELSSFVHMLLSEQG